MCHENSPVTVWVAPEQPIEVGCMPVMRVSGARRDSGVSQPEVRRGSDVDEV